MSESDNNRKVKIDSLFKQFKDIGYTSNDKLDKKVLIQFLDRRSKTGKFDKVILDKLFQVLNLDSLNNISIEDFISGYLQFEEDIKNRIEELKTMFDEKQKIYNELIEKSKKYKEEKLNSEGLSEKAKIYGEITEIDIQRKLKGIEEIIIKVKFNEELKEFHFQIGEINNKEMKEKKFEFKPTSRKDHFEFIMQALNDEKQVFDIGSKVFPLMDIDTQEEYLVQITIPEIEDEEKIAAYVKAKILFYWSDYKFYEEQKLKAEIKLNKVKSSLTKALDYLQKIREIYGDSFKERYYILEFNNKMTVELKIEFNNTKLIKEKDLKKENDTQNKELIEEGLTNVETKKNKVVFTNEDFKNVFGVTRENNKINEEKDNNEIIKETKIENCANEKNKEIVTESILPTIIQEKINEVIYDKNITTLPLIYGKTEVTYVKEGESLYFDNYNLNEQNPINVNKEEQNNNKQISEIQNFNNFQSEYNLQEQSYGFEEYNKSNY